LRKKYDYLKKRNGVLTAENFIKGAASQSSVTGKPYQVRCGNDAQLSSQRWLTDELARFRKHRLMP
jgi:hypothetical protein